MKKENLIVGILVICALLICAIMCRGIYIHSIDSRVSFSEIWQLKSSKQILNEVENRYDREEIEKIEAKSFDKDTEGENEEEQDIEETEDEYIPVIESDVNWELEELRIRTGYYEEKKKEAEEAALAEARERDKDNMRVEINNKEVADIIDQDIPEEEKEEKLEEKFENDVIKTDNENIVTPKDKEEVLPVVNEKPEDNITYIDEYTRNNNGVIEEYDTVFGWLPKGPEGKDIQIEDQGGDWNKMVGTMN